MPAPVVVPNPMAMILILSILATIVGAWIWVALRLALAMPVLPPRTPRIVPWGAGSVLAAVLFWLSLQISVPLFYHARIQHKPADANAKADANPEGGEKTQFDQKPGEMMALSAVANALTLTLVPLLLAATSGARPKDLGVVAEGLPRQMGRGMLAYPLLAPIVFGAMGVALLVWGRTSHPLEEAIGQDKTPAMVIIFILASVVLAPAAEELIFRGVLLGWLTSLALGSSRPRVPTSMVQEIDPFLPDEPSRSLLETVEIDPNGSAPVPPPPDTAEHAIHNPYAPPTATITRAIAEPALIAGTKSRALPLLAANVVVSLIFAMLHGPIWPTPIPLFFLSLGLGFLYQRTGSILAPIALHMTFNGVSTTMMFLLLGGPAPNAVPKVPVPAPAVAATNQEFPGFFTRLAPLTAIEGFDTVFFPNAMDDVGCSIGATASAALGAHVPLRVEDCLDPRSDFSDKLGTRSGPAGFGSSGLDGPALYSDARSSSTSARRRSSGHRRQG